MSDEEARKWRQATERRLDVWGAVKGQAFEHLPREVDSLWFGRFMDGTTNFISRTMKEDIFLALGPNWRTARGQKYTRENIIHYTDEELLNIFSMDPKQSDD